MSEFKIACPHCDQHIAYDESYWGVQIQCPACTTPIRISAPAAGGLSEHVPLAPPPAPGAGGLRIAKSAPSMAAHQETRPHIPPRPNVQSRPKGKSWLTTFLFACFLGGIGVDRFYNGRTGLGIGKVLSNVLTCGIVGGIWQVVDIILLLFKKYQDAQGNYLQPARRSHTTIALSVVAAMFLVSIVAVASTVKSIKSEVAGISDTAERINCVNNLKQAGLAFRLWSNDHNDQFPFNVPAAKGGSLPFCQRTADGFDANAFRHFQVLSNELNTPMVLVCPGDSSKKPAADWRSLGPANVTYLLRSGPRLSDRTPGEELARCPIHNSALYCDGQVKQETNRQIRGPSKYSGHLNDGGYASR